MLRDYVVELQSTNPNTTVKIAVEMNTDPFLPTRGIIPAIKTVYPSAEYIYCLRHIYENINQGWCGQAYKNLLWRVASATNVRDFEKFMLELKTMNLKAHQWLNKIPAEHWARSHFSGRAKSDLLLNKICEVFNGKIIRGRDKLVITLLEYIREYCIKRIMNVQGVIDKRTGPLTPTGYCNQNHRIHQERSSFDEGIPYKHAVGACWNMALNDWAAPPLEMKGRTITCQSCRNTKHNKVTCKGQGGNNSKTSGSASRQAQQTEPAVGQDGLGGSGASTVIGFFGAAGKGGAGGLGVASQVPVSETRNADGKEIGDDVPTQSSAAGGASEWSFL
nr:hypothetical protein [Tanacetum cinerariifolium]